MFGLLDSEALTKIQSLILIAVIVIAALGGVAAYVLLGGEEQSTEPIRIGILADVDFYGKPALQEAILAAEQVNAEGGILGRQVEIVEEDCLSGTDFDSGEVSNALTRLITVDQADFVIGQTIGESVFVCQEMAAEYEKIYFETFANQDEFTQRVLDDYSNYRYYFSHVWNTTSANLGVADSLLLLKEMTGFTKVGIVGASPTLEVLEQFLPENGFDLVYESAVPYETMDFSSYFAQAEAAGVEVMVPWIPSQAGLAFVKEYADRQSPMVVYGGLVIDAGDARSCEWTDGKCNYGSFVSFAPTAGYPLTSKTIPFREAYMDEYGEFGGGFVYDIVRFVLPDAIERAGTIETDAVIEALEETRVETSNAREFVFTESHALMMGKNPNDPEANYPFVILFQWQNGEQVPVYPKKIMEEAGSTYIYPDWDGPWNK